MSEECIKELQAYINILPTIQKAIFYDIGITLADCEKYLLSLPVGNLPFTIPVGSPIKEGSGIHKAIHEERQVFFRADKAQRGVAYIVCSTPIRNGQGVVIGALSIAESTSRYDMLKEIAGGLSRGIGELASTSEQLAAQSQEIAAASRQLAEATQESGKRTHETNQILGIIKDVAAQTNLLGLNAAIEAARVGEAGRGFGVVASEIRKLSSSSADSVQEIVRIISMIKSDNEQVCEEMSTFEVSIAQISEAVTHLAESIQEINMTAQKLNSMADELDLKK